jgi:GNAT superfamily N-acetyltransferase
MEFTLAKSNDDLTQILALQKINLKHANSPEVETDQGFVTVQHDMELISFMNEAAAHVIAQDNGRVIGYALAMTRAFKDKVPALRSMFDMLDDLKIENKKLGDESYIVMGQICVDKSYRGQGVFRNLYKLFFDMYKPVYRNIITEVAARNTRSLNAHLSVGFEEIYRYEEQGVEEWVVIIYR